MRKHKQNWLDIFSGFRVALDARKIILGTLGAYCTFILLWILFFKLAACWWPDGVERMGDLLRYSLGRPLVLLRGVGCELCKVFCGLSTPGGCGEAFKKLAFLTGSGVIVLFLWSFVGGAIARLAAVDFAQDERPQIAEGLSFAWSKFGSFFWAPIVPLLFVLALLLCNVLVGVIGRIPVLGPILMAILFALTIVSGFLIVLLLIGAFFGSGFMWPTIAMEGTDAFDAISRAFNYLYARPWKTLWCWLCAAAYGAAVVAFVGAFTCLLSRIALRSVALGMGPGFASLHARIGSGPPDAGSPFSTLFAMIFIRVVIVTVIGLFLGFIVSYKISALTIIYSILRRDVDGTDMSEVFLPEPEETPAEPPPAEEKPEPPAEEQKT